MATLDDINNSLNNLNTNISNFISAMGSGGGGFSGRGGGVRSRRGPTVRDFERDEEEHNKKMRDIQQSKNENLSETERYLKGQEDIEERLLRLEEKRNDLLDEYNTLVGEEADLLEKVRDGSATEEEINRLEYIRDLKKDIYGIEEETLTLEKKRSDGGLGKAILGDLNGIMSSFKQIYNSIDDLTKPYRKVDAAASKYAKTVGMTKAGMDSLAKTSLNNVASKLASTYNISTAELLEAQANYIKASGRNIRLDNADQENMAAMHKMGGNGNEIAALYDNFGVSMEETADHVGKMFSDASKQGLSFEKYSDNVAKNIKIAQNYTFKNGLKGLESMAKKATAMKMDMQQVAALADKVSTVEGAIDVSSQLQVLGGPFAQLADPLGMLNEGLNDMEGLQDRLIKMVGGLGSFDKETGEVKVSSFNKQRIKAASQAMGVDYGTIMESVNAQARRGEISKQIAASEVASGFSDDMKELIMNSGTIKDGKAGVSIKGKFKSVDELTEKDYEALQAESRTESEDIKVAAQSLQSIDEKIESFETAKEARQAQMYDNVAEGFGSVMKWLSKLGPLLTVVTIIQGVVAAGQVIGGLGNILKGGKGVVKGLWNGAKKLFGGGGSAGGSANTIGGKLKNLFGGGGSVGGSANTIGGNGSMLDDVFKRGKDLFDGAFKQGKSILGNITKGGKNVLGNMMKGGKGLIGSLMKSGKGLIGSLMKSGQGILSNLLSSGKNLLGNLFSGGGGGGGLLSRAFNGIKGLFKGGKGGRVGKLLGKAWNGAKSIFKGGGSSIVKGGVGRTMKRAGLKVLGKAGVKTAAKIGTKLAMGVAKGGPLGVIGAVGDVATDALVASGKIKKGGLAHNAMSGASGALSGAATGAMIGSIIPGIGTAIGAAVGAVVGGIKGLWKAGGIQKIGKGIAKVAKKAWGGIKNIGKGIGNLFKKTPVGKAISAFSKTKVGKAVGSALGAIGGVFGIGRKKKIKKFEAKSKKSAAEILKGYSTNIKPVLEKGNNAKYGAVNKANNDIHLKSDPHDIKINGTLNVRGQDGKTIDLVSELRNNPHMLRQVSDMISNEMGVLQKGTNVVQRA